MSSSRASEHYDYAGPLAEADTFVMLVDADGYVYGNTTDAVLAGSAGHGRRGRGGGR